MPTLNMGRGGGGGRGRYFQLMSVSTLLKMIVLFKNGSLYVVANYIFATLVTPISITPYTLATLETTL